MGQGREQRRSHPRRKLGELVAADRSAVEILVEQNADRLPDLVPLRFARMLTDPFAFYRGTAAVMAADLACSPGSGVQVLSCGDAHVSNFGIYASPERELVFDLNDFDETAAAPWEWDLKRLVTSAVIGGRHSGFRRSQIDAIARAAVVEYTDGLRQMLRLTALQRYYLHAQPELVLGDLDPQLQSIIERTLRRARKRTSDRVFAKIMEPTADGGLRLREDPPVLMHLPDVKELATQSYRAYLASVSPDIAMLLSQFELTDVARRVVGVGSVGTRCYLLVFTGPAGEPLVLQVKEAMRSVLEQHGRVELPAELADFTGRFGQGARVVGGQRILQSVSDPFLGFTRFNGSDYHVRQFHDMKGTIETEGMGASAFGGYVRACALLLARAHAQSPTAPAVREYIGKGPAVVEPIVGFAEAYADKSLADFEELRRAAARRDIEVAPDPAR